jgi:hypothetical protein
MPGRSKADAPSGQLTSQRLLSRSRVRRSGRRANPHPGRSSDRQTFRSTRGHVDSG